MTRGQPPTSKGSPAGRGKRRPPWVAVGWDQSPNHLGIVAVNPSGGMIDHFWITPTKKRALRGNSFHLSKENWKGLDPDARDARRLIIMRRVLAIVARRFCKLSPLVYFAIEGYAFGSKGRAHTTGEIGGLARLAILDGGGKLRVHDPTTVKLFATGKGNADKDFVRAGAEALWGVDFAHLGKAEAEDLTDAYVLAMLVRCEMRLRLGEVTLKELREEEIRIVNRVTKSQPVNLLDRSWIEA